MSNSKKTISCASHGRREIAAVCQHLPGANKGLNTAYEPDEEYPFPDAWCDECAVVRAKAGGVWTKEAEEFAHVTVICSSCYQGAKERNFVQRPPTGQSGPV